MAEEPTNHEKRRHDPISTIVWGLILVVLGGSLYLPAQDLVGWGEWWAYFLLGLGSIFVIEWRLRLAMPAYRRAGMGKLVAGLILVGIGAANIFSFKPWWPLILVVIGVGMVVHGIRRARRPGWASTTKEPS